MSEKFRKDLTQGSVTKQLLKFSVPFLLSNLLQALYSVADMVIVGQFCGKSGITGVSIGGQINILVTGAALGLAIGGTVLIAQYGGAKKYDDQKSTIGTMTTLYIILSAVLTVVMVLLTKPILRLLKTPDNAFEEAVRYLTICMLGTVFMFLYNAISGRRRSGGCHYQLAGDKRYSFAHLSLQQRILLRLQNKRFQNRQAESFEHNKDRFAVVCPAGYSLVFVSDADGTRQFSAECGCCVCLPGNRR